MKKLIILFSLASFMHNPMVLADEMITLFLTPYPTVDENYAQELSESLKTPGTIDHHRLHGILDKNPAAGIFALHGGWLNISDASGQLIFPRHLEKPFLYLVITTHITPIVITANTLSHWQFQPGIPTEMYSIEKKSDPKTKAFFWQTEKVEQLPANMHIPFKSIIIFAKPKYIYVPTGITLSNDRNNLVLPPVYVKKGIKILPNTLYVLNIKQFFGKVNTMHKTRDKDYEELIKP
jgi:hypothetical protein